MKKIFLSLLISTLFVMPVYGQATTSLENDNIIIESLNIESNEIEDWFKNIKIDEAFKNLILSSTSVKTRYCNATNVNIRTEPNTKCKIIDRLLLNTCVEVIAEYNGWSCITGESGIAFVKSDYLQEEMIKQIELGEFKITHYCCEKRKHICGTGTGITKSGTEVRPGIISVDPKVIPLGSKVIINGKEFTAEDTGGRIKGHKIDMAVATHEEAKELGIYHATVYLVLE